MAEQRINRIVAGDLQVPVQEITSTEARKIMGGRPMTEDSSKSTQERNRKKSQEQAAKSK